MLDVLVSPFFALVYGAVLVALLTMSLVRLNASFRRAEAFLRTTCEWTLQVRNESAFLHYRKSVADEALAGGGLHTVWSEFLDEIHIRYNDDGHPLAESSTEALDKVKHDLMSTFEKMHKVTRLTSPTLAVLGLLGAVFAVGVGALSAAPFLQETPADAAKALAALFSVGGLAFVAAAAGLLGAIAFRATERWQTQRVERRVDALANHLRGFVSFRGEPYFLAELAYTLRADRTGVKEFGQELLHRLEKREGEGGALLQAIHGLATDAQAHSDKLLGIGLEGTQQVVSALALQTDTLSKVTREQAEVVVNAFRESVKTDGTSAETLSVARNQLSALISLESAVQSLELKVVQGLAQTADAIIEGGVRSNAGFRVVFEEHGRDLRQALEKLSTEFGSALHVSGRDLYDSLSSLPESLALRLKDVHAVQFADATVLAKLVRAAESPEHQPSAQSDGSIVINRPEDERAFESVNARIEAEALYGHALRVRSIEEAAAHPDAAEESFSRDSDTAISLVSFSGGVLQSETNAENSTALNSSLSEIPATVQVMLGCLELLQSGLRGLGTVRAQLDYLGDTSDRLRRLLSDIQAAALPVDNGAELPEWWNARATRVVELLARIDEVLSTLKDTASTYDALAEASLGENFVRLARSAESLWKDNEVPAIVENLWSGSRTPSQLVKGVTALKAQTAMLCRSLLGAQRHALSLENELGEVWKIAREPSHQSESFWKILEESALHAQRRGKVLGAARKRVVFPSVELEAGVLPALTSLSRLVEETDLCLNNRSSKKARGSDKLPKAG